MFNDSQLQDLYRYCLSLAGDQDKAYDLLHSAYEKYLRLSKTDIERPFGYFRRMIHNQFVDHQRRLSKDPVSVEDLTIIPLDEPDIEDLYITREELHQLLKQLSSEERELLFLWSVEGYSTQELADFLEKPKGTILSKLHRLRMKLQADVQHRTGGES